MRGTGFQWLGTRTIRPLWVTLLAMLVLLVGFGILAYTTLFGSARHSQFNDDAATYQGTEVDGSAPDFELIDQRGQRFALSDFRGKVVVLSFLDPNCTDTCPLTALHFQQAYDALEPTEAEAVAFLAVNVNVEVNAVADVARATKLWGMSEFSAWHFLTGDAETLRAAWRAYGVEALPDTDKDGEVTHTPGVFVIDPAGDKRWYIYTPLTGDLEWDGPQLAEILPGHIRELVLHP